MRRQTFYLDTNVISRLAEPEITRPEIRARLALLVRSGACEIIGAAEIIEEFAAIARTKPERFGKSLEVFWTLVGEKVLIGRKRLLVNEIKKGSMLSRPEAFLDAETVRRLQTLPLDNVAGWDEIAKGVRGQGKEFTSSMHESADKVCEVMLKSVTAKDVRKNAGQLEASEKTVKDWFRHVLKSNQETLGLPKDESKWPDAGQLPCTRAFVSILIALTKKHHMARDHKYRVSDEHDVDHYTNAAMAGCLVTSDQKLADTSHLILWRPFPVVDTDDFLAKTQRM